MIYHLVNKRTKILPLATFYIVHLGRQFILFLNSITCMLCFKSINFHQNKPKIKLWKSFERCWPKNLNLWQLGALPQTPCDFRRLGASPSDPKNSALIILNFWLHAYVRVQCTDLQNILAESSCFLFNSVYFCHFWHGSNESDHVVFKVQCHHEKKSKKRNITLAFTYWEHFYQFISVKHFTCFGQRSNSLAFLITKMTQKIRINVLIVLVS